MPYLGEIFSVLCAVVWALAVIYFRIAGASVPATELNLLKCLISAVLLGVTWGILMIFSPETHAFNFSLNEMGLLVLSGVIGISLADTLLLKSLALIGASRNAVLSCLFSPFVIVIAVLFLGERFNSSQFLGFVVVIIGTVLVTIQKSDMSISVRDLRMGSLYGILSVLFIAVGMTLTKPIVNDSSVIATALLRMLAGFIGSLIWVLVSGRTMESLGAFKGDLPWKAILISTFLGSYLALMFWILGFQQTETSTASTLNQTSVLFTLIFAALILKERMSKRKIVGAVLGFLGVVFIFLNS